MLQLWFALARDRWGRRNGRTVALLFALGLLGACGRPVSVLTYRNDNYRSGWNDDERTLTSANVNPVSFGQLFNIPLDDQVDVQPLVLGMSR